MTARKELRRLVLLGLGLASSLGTVACSGKEGRGPWGNWTALRYRVEGVPLVTGRVELSLADGPQGRLLETTSTASFVGATVAESRTETLFDPGSGRIRRHTSSSRGRGRRFVFDDAGYTVERLRSPQGREVPPGEWEVTDSSRFSHPEPQQSEARPILLDTTSLLLHLRDLDLAHAGDETTVHVATAHGPRRYRIRVAHGRTRSRTYVDLATGDDRIETLSELLLRVEPTEPGEAEAGLGGLLGQAELWVEAETKTPLELSGKVPRVPGTVRLVLEAVGSAPSAPAQP